MRHFYSLLFLSTLTLQAAPADWIWSARYVVTMDAHGRSMHAEVAEASKKELARVL